MSEPTTPINSSEDEGAKKIGELFGNMMSMGCGTGEYLDNISCCDPDEVFESNIPLKRGSNYSAGYDILSAESVSIPPNTILLVKTGLILNIPAGYYFDIRTKSRHVINNATISIEGSPKSFAEEKKGKTPEEVAELMKKYTLYSAHPVTVEGGLIDSDYYQEVHVALYNHSPTQSFKVNTGDAIAQGVLLKHYLFTNEVKGNLAERVGGFGSTN